MCAAPLLRTSHTDCGQSYGQKSERPDGLNHTKQTEGLTAEIRKPGILVSFSESVQGAEIVGAPAVAFAAAQVTRTGGACLLLQPSGVHYRPALLDGARGAVAWRCGAPGRIPPGNVGARDFAP